MHTTRTAAAMAALALAATSCATADTVRAAGGSIEEKPTKLEQAVADCDEMGLGSDYVTLGDEGRSLTADHQGDEDAAGASLEELVCVLAMSDVPDSVIAQMEQTRALDGMQSAEWDGLTATWTYHPDNGMDLILEETR